MRSGRAPGFTDGADHLAPFHMIAFLDRRGIEMKVHRIETQTVVKNDAFPAKKVIIHHFHNAVIGGFHRRTERRGNILSVMLVTRLAVQDAFAAERAGDRGANPGIQ